MRPRTSGPSLLVILLLLTLGLGSAPPAIAITIEPPFDTVYTFTDLGSVPSLPPEYGGLTFKPADPNTLLIGGAGNTAAGRIYEVGVVRGAGNHIVGFSGPATMLGFGAFNDGGVVFGPGGVLFLARWPNNELGQVKPASLVEDKITDLGPLGVVASPGGLEFVPAGFPGAGQFKLVSWPGGEWYTLTLAPDGSGTFDITSATLETTIVGGPEGIVYVPPGSPLFAAFDSMLVAEWTAGNVVAYSLDANGDPEPLSRTLFITGLEGAEGAVVDPLTGDFLFSTFGGGDRVIVVQGFVPPQPAPAPATLLLLGLGLGGSALLARRRRG
ncbi:MAG TPA: PEP-CTERM sorting domain-containing protein [Methylomirabilota bacterium]|nr:PEP-CTERM sorting domain-containing protein [Methylomirabilota bacterium]